ncbi:MAG: hypothetical protein C0489_00815 [Candidatus Accumulibacter sp.]|nr:hypothetical protein [Accumulibacter sp.]
MSTKLWITSVNPGGRAERAGVKSRDILVSYNGRDISTAALLSSAIAAAPEGQSIALRVLRDDQPIDLRVEAGTLGIAFNESEDAEISYQQFLKRLGLNSAKQGEILRQVESEQLLRDRLNNMQITTAHSIEGYRVVKTVDVITAECVFGLNVFKDFFMGLTDFFGGRSSTAQDALRDARKKCLQELKKEALSLGANAVIAISLDYSEFSGKGNSMLFLVASGTAVVVEPNQAVCE